MHKTIAISAIAVCIANLAPAQNNHKEMEIAGIVGQQDTHKEPNAKWHVHDLARPQPPVVTPGQFSQMAAAPNDAIVLFDGKDLSKWCDRKTGGPVGWKVEDGAAISADGDIMTTNQFGDMQLHLEFCEPESNGLDGQARGNSGIYLMGRYEIQVLDCYHNKTYADGTTGAIYGQQPPLANACLPPGEWQTYDIIFNAPHFDADGKLLTPPYVTVILNGVLLQNHQVIHGNTTNPVHYKPVGPTGPLVLQYHKNPVSFRNIWVRSMPVVDEP